MTSQIFKVLTFCAIILTSTSSTPNYAVAASSGRQLFNIADYGAKRDGSVLATEAFQQAIQAAKAAGGGTIYVPPGKYISGPIELFSNMIQIGRASCRERVQSS